jgi:hypothetical protein
LSKEVVDSGFKFISCTGVLLCEGRIVGVGSTSVVGDEFNGLLIDSGLQKRLTNNPEVGAIGLRLRRSEALPANQALSFKL